MEISGITSSINTAGAGSAGKTVGKDEFLKLFTTQLQYQNPLNPMDGAAFTSQLAQFSSLEQLTNISAQMKDLLLYQNSLQNTMTASLIGKQVEFTGNEVYLKDKADIKYTLSKDASNVSISIYDAGGKLVRKVNVGQQNAGDRTYAWDGKDSSGIALPEGQYKIKVEALDSQGNAVDVNTMTSGTVTGITFENNITYLIIDGTLRIQLGDIKKITGGGA